LLVRLVMPSANLPGKLGIRALTVVLSNPFWHLRQVHTES